MELMKTFIKVLIIIFITVIAEIPITYISHTGIAYHNMGISAAIIYCQITVGFVVYYICKLLNIKL